MNYKDSENLKQVKMETGRVPFFPFLQLLSFFFIGWTYLCQPFNSTECQQRNFKKNSKFHLKKN